LATPGPPALASDEAALLAFAALGGPADSLDRLSRTLVRQLESQLQPAELADAYAWFGLPASLSFHAHPLPDRTRFASDWLVWAQLAHERGDDASARDTLEARGSVRGGVPPYGRTLDALFAEAALLAELRQPEAVIAWLDPTLLALPEKPSQVGELERMAGLVRCAVLRADAAAALGRSAEAAAWANAVATLWSDADAFLQPEVERMQRMAECESC
jgi:hypothetical protein